MGLCSLEFLYLVLPGLLALWRLCPRAARPYLLMVYSFAWYVREAGWQYGLLMGASLLWDWAMAGVAHKGAYSGRKRLAIALSAGKSLVLALIFTLAFPADAYPLGLMVYGVSGLWYVINAARGYAGWMANPVHMLSCGSFFPALYAGPPVDLAKNISRMENICPVWENMGDGGGQFIRGLAKKVVLGDLLAKLPADVLALGSGGLTMVDVLLLLVSQMLALYYSLTGYWDMGCGIGKMLGLLMQENDNNPFLSKGVNDFFGRFNITVNRFIRRNVYLTLGGSKKRGVLLVRNVLLSSVCMGLWFGFTANFALWGLVLGGFVLLERQYLRHSGYVAGGVFHWMYAMVALLVSFCFFIGESPAQSLYYLRVLFGGGAGFSSDTSVYFLLSNLPLLLFALFCICGLPQKVAALARRKLPSFCEAGGLVWSLLLLIVSTAFLMD